MLVRLSLTSVAFVDKIIQDPTANDDHHCNANDSLGCLLRELAFGADGI